MDFLVVLSEYWLDNLVDDALAISTINKMEVLGFRFADKTELIPFEEFIQTVFVFPLTTEIEIKTIELRQKIKIKLPDAIIAATALVNNFDTDIKKCYLNFSSSSNSSNSSSYRVAKKP